MMDKIIHYLDLCFRNIPASVLVGMLLFFCIETFLLFLFLGREKGLRWSAGLILLEYMLLLLVLAVFTRTVRSESAVDLSPFWSYRAIRDGSKSLSTQIIANVVAFIPIGLLSSCVFGRIKWWRALLFGGAFSLLIETLQFVLKRGHVETDDVMHNVLGCAIGLGVYAGVTWALKRVRKK